VQVLEAQCVVVCLLGLVVGRAELSSKVRAFKTSNLRSFVIVVLMVGQ
jgi:hypothetical protein